MYSRMQRTQSSISFQNAMQYTLYSVQYAVGNHYEHTVLFQLCFKTLLTSLGLLFHSLNLVFSSLCLTSYALQFNDVPNKEPFSPLLLCSSPNFPAPSFLSLSIHLLSLSPSHPLTVCIDKSLNQNQTSTSPQTKTRACHFGKYDQIFPVVSVVLQHKHDRFVM